MTTSQVFVSRFAARGGQPADYCQQRVRDCEIYLAVVGFRYGSLVPGEDVSYTELEFLEATVVGRPRAGVPARRDRRAARRPHRQRPDGGGRVRQRLQEAGLICAMFASAEGLELAVFQALKELAGTGGRMVPRQLPTSVAHFAGRAAERATLAGLLLGRAAIGGTVVISAIGGTAGVGKTALAVWWAHRVADRFPDGSCLSDLRGFGPSGSVVAFSADRNVLAQC